MDQPGQGDDIMTEENPYVINNPKLKSVLRNGIELSVTTIAWTIWIYLLIPLVTWLLWYAGIRVTFLEHFIMDNMKGLASVIGYYSIGIVGILLVFFMWSSYNRFRFRGHDRRTHGRNVTEKELSEFFNIPADDIEKARTIKQMSVVFKDDSIELRV
jgi:biofilm PGA synthesis protein PgaD